MLNDNKEIFIIYPETNYVTDKVWKKADEMINGFEMCCDLKESLQKALMYAKNSRCAFVVQYRNKSKIKDRNNVECFVLYPNDTSIRVFFKN